jgi:hypothetical protein
VQIIVVGAGAGPPGRSAASAAPAPAVPVLGALVLPLVPAAPVTDEEAVPPPDEVAVQAHSAGQSVFEAQVSALGAHQPGNEVVVVQLSGGGGATKPGSAGAVAPVLGAEPPPEPDAVPVEPGAATPLPPEHMPLTVGLHLNPAPQSVSVLQGSCQVNMHVETFVSVHVGGGGATFAPQSVVLGAQAGAVPPVQLEIVSVWQTMPVPQSVSAVQGPGEQ